MKSLHPIGHFTAIIICLCGLSIGAGCADDPKSDAPALNPADACQSCDMTGTWMGTWHSGEFGSGSFTVALNQNARALSGAIELSELGYSNTALSGTITGSDISFGDIEQTISFIGTTGNTVAAGHYTLQSYNDKGQWQIYRVRRGAYNVAECRGTMNSVFGVAFDGSGYWFATGYEIGRMDMAGNVLLTIPRPGDNGTVGGSPRLAFDGEALWYGNGSELYRLSAANPSQILAKPTLADEHAEIYGLAFINNHLWVATHGADIVLLDKTGAQTGALTFPTQVMAMAFDGALVWVAGSDAHLYGVTPKGIPRALYEIADGRTCEDITFDGTSLWCASLDEDGICPLSAPAGDVTVTPATVTMVTGDTRQFVATVNSAFANSVVWSIQEGPACGAISAEGLYQAPIAVPATPCHVVATNPNDPTRTGVAEVSLLAAAGIQIQVQPQTAAMYTGETTQFAATVTGATDTRVNWRLSNDSASNCGAIDNDGMYHAPASTVWAKLECTIEAVSGADPTIRAQALITVSEPPVPSITITPTSVYLNQGEQVQFTAQVTNATSTDVIWSANCGVIDASGLYTAPLESFVICSVWAHSAVDNDVFSFTAVLEEDL